MAIAVAILATATVGQRVAIARTVKVVMGPVSLFRPQVQEVAMGSIKIAILMLLVILHWGPSQPPKPLQGYQLLHQLRMRRRVL